MNTQEIAAAPVPMLLQLDDQVMIRRNLKHPAWMREVEADPRDGGAKWVPEEGIEEEIGVGRVIRICPASLFSRGEVLVANGFWYDDITGSQVGSGATVISRHTV